MNITHTHAQRTRVNLWYAFAARLIPLKSPSLYLQQGTKNSTACLRRALETENVWRVHGCAFIPTSRNLSDKAVQRLKVTDQRSLQKYVLSFNFAEQKGLFSGTFST